MLEIEEVVEKLKKKIPYMNNEESGVILIEIELTDNREEVIFHFQGGDIEKLSSEVLLKVYKKSTRENE